MAEIIKEAKNKVEWVSEEERPTYGEQSAVQYCEETYPEMMAEYKRICGNNMKPFVRNNEIMVQVTSQLELVRYKGRCKVVTNRIVVQNE